MSRRPETTELGKKQVETSLTAVSEMIIWILILNTKDKQIVTTGIIAEVNKKKKREKWNEIGESICNSYVL